MLRIFGRRATEFGRLVLLALVINLAAACSGEPDPEVQVVRDYMAFRDLDGVVRASQLIVIAELRGEREEVTKPGGTDDRLIDVVREFGVVEVLKGDASLATVSVRATRETRLAARNGIPALLYRYEKAPVEGSGMLYVLFLRAIPPHASAGPSGWSYAGHPAHALLAGDTVRFWLEPSVASELGAGATVSATTLPSLRDAIARSAGP